MSKMEARFQLNYDTFNLDIDIKVPMEGVTVIYGPSGCGKTTLLRCLAGLERSAAGYLRFGSKVWQDESGGIFIPPHQRSIGTVFQEARLFPHLTVKENLLFGFKRTPPEKRKIPIEQVVDILNLDHLLSRSLKGLSGGEQQRIAIGRAILTSPDLLLMDEPLANLDVQRKLEIVPFLLRLRKDLGLPIVYVSHSINEVLQLVDTIVLMKEGKKLVSGSINEVLSQTNLPGYFGQQLAGTVLETKVVEHDQNFSLTKVEYNGQFLYIPKQSASIGEGLRLLIHANDVSIVLEEKNYRTSVLNILEAKILEIAEADQRGYSINIKLDIGAPLLATITKKSFTQLDLCLGQKIFAHIKAVKMVQELEEF
ncbi:MAG: molybdenum ABC transporter ATP-binding protein [Nitrospinales bacterium]